MNSKENVVVDILYEFLEVSIHNILYVRKLYPDGIFVKKKKYGVAVYQSLHPQLNEYISESLKAVKFHAKSNQLQCLLLCIVSDKTVHERFVFDVVNILNNFEGDTIYLKLEQSLRDFCLKLHASSEYLTPLPKEATFRIVLHTTEYSNLSLGDDPSFENFPWINVSEKECRINSPDIVPIHTVDSSSLIIQIYVEKNKDAC